MRADPSKVEALFHRALEFAPSERAAFLAGACGEDSALRKRVDALLAAHEQANRFLPGEKDPEPIPTVMAETPLREEAGLLIGRYKLLERLGEGGFGAVWLAEQKEPVRRKVALKIIKLGMDTRQVVARFEAERQALAMMDHPNIAKVLDAGTTDAGRPYFVMELVRGVRITEYCDQANLSTTERLNLFIKVCHALQHAHQKGIIHRDIKPSNILVTLHDGVPVPKVIDFGIAKATQGELTDKTVHTQFQQFIGTPAYMSPEQAEMSGLDIDTRSDIYSLGVLLYELLTSKTPFDSDELLHSGLDEMRRIIREKEPVRPSTRLDSLRGEERTTAARRRQADSLRLAHLLRGDLDWIVMKCLEKDRTRRYETANGIAMDIKRYLESEPVLARPPSTLYRFQKLVRRNKVAFTAGIAVLGALLLGTGASTIQAVRASRAERAQRRLFSEAETARLKERTLRQQADEASAKALTAEREALQNLYAADMLLASQALEKGNLGRQRKLLGKYAKPQLILSNDLRGWEWRFLSERSRGDELFTLRGHTNAVPFAVFLDDRTILSAGQDFTLKFWDVNTRSLIDTVGLADRPRRVALSGDGRLFAVAGEFGTWSLWSVASRTLLMQRTNRLGVAGVALSPDGARLALADTEFVELWNTKDQRQIKKLARREDEAVGDGFVLGLAFSPDGENLAYCRTPQNIFIHNVSTGTERLVGKALGSDALALAFSPDGQCLVSADRFAISVWELTRTSSPRRLTNHLEQIVCVAFSPDGQWLASASGDQTIKLWSTKNWREIATFRGHEHEVHSVNFSPNGKLLVSSSKDESVRVWPAKDPERARDWLPFSAMASVWEGRSTSNLWIAQPNQQAVILDLARLRPRQTERFPDSFSNAVFRALSSNSDLLALGSSDGSVELWRTVPLARQATVARSPVPLTALALAESGRLLAVQRTNETTEIWNIQEDRLTRSFPPLGEPVRGFQHYNGLSFWAGDRCLARATAKPSGTIEVIQLDTGVRQLIRHTHKDDISNFAISDDGELLATAAWDAAVKLWDVRSGRELATLTGQLVGYLGLAFTPDGTRLAAGGHDGSITLWDVRNYLQLCNWKAHAYGCSWLSFIDGGRTLASLGAQSAPGRGFEVRLWHAPASIPIEGAEYSDKLRQASAAGSRD